VEPERHEEPEETEQPEEPARPEQPERPEPEEPEEPEEPQRPEQPERPDEPLRPGESEEPEAPAEQQQQEEPVEPEEPERLEELEEAPGELEEPERPEEPQRPEEPEEPEPAELEPEEPGEPEEPEEPERPVEPGRPEERPEVTEPELEIPERPDERPEDDVTQTAFEVPEPTEYELEPTAPTSQPLPGYEPTETGERPEEPTEPEDEGEPADDRTDEAGRSAAELAERDRDDLRRAEERQAQTEANWQGELAQELEQVPESQSPVVGQRMGEREDAGPVQEIEDRDLPDAELAMLREAAQARVLAAPAKLAAEATGLIEAIDRLPAASGRAIRDLTAVSTEQRETLDQLRLAWRRSEPQQPFRAYVDGRLTELRTFVNTSQLDIGRPDVNLGVLAADSPSMVTRLYADWLEKSSRSDEPATPFDEYAEERMSSIRGLEGEQRLAFVVGQRMLMIQPPGAVNAPGIDLITTAEGRIQLRDNKAIRDDKALDHVSALEWNLEKNLAQAVQELRQAIEQARAGEWAETARRVADRLEAARADIAEWRSANAVADLRATETQQAFAEILGRHQIDRVVDFQAAGPRARMAQELVDRGFDEGER
jgi:hypothetical protein